MKTKKICRFCEEKAIFIDYKDDKKLQKFVTEQGKIIPRWVTGVCAKHQRMLNTAIKRARHLAIMPYVAEAVK